MISKGWYKGICKWYIKAYPGISYGYLSRISFWDMTSFDLSSCSKSTLDIPRYPFLSLSILWYPRGRTPRCHAAWAASWACIQSREPTTVSLGLGIRRTWGFAGVYIVTPLSTNPQHFFWRSWDQESWELEVPFRITMPVIESETFRYNHVFLSCCRWNFRPKQ